MVALILSCTGSPSWYPRIQCPLINFMNLTASTSKSGDSLFITLTSERKPSFLTTNSTKTDPSSFSSFTY